MPTNKISQMAATTQTGISTHHQDQWMMPASLRTMNATVRRPVKPTPPEWDDVLLLMKLDKVVDPKEKGDDGEEACGQQGGDEHGGQPQPR